MIFYLHFSTSQPLIYVVKKLLMQIILTLFVYSVSTAEFTWRQIAEDDKRQWICKVLEGGVRRYFKVLYRYSPDRSDRNHEFALMISGTSKKIRSLCYCSSIAVIWRMVHKFT